MHESLPRQLVAHDPEAMVWTTNHKNVCLKTNVQQPGSGRKICHGTVTPCDEAKLSRSRVWIAAPGSEAALRTGAAEELAFSFMS